MACWPLLHYVLFNGTGLFFRLDRIGGVPEMPGWVIIYGLLLGTACGVVYLTFRSISCDLDLEQNGNYSGEEFLWVFGIIVQQVSTLRLSEVPS